MSESTFQTTSADGTPIGGLRAGSGARGLVLVHGTGSAAIRWQPLLGALGEHFTVFAMDRRGRGASPDPAANGYTLEQEFEDVRAVIDLAAGETGQSTFMMAHSFGGLCALGASAGAGAGNIERMVLYEPTVKVGPLPYPIEVIDQLDQLLQAQGPEAVLTTFMVKLVQRPPEDVERLKQHPEAWSARLAATPTIPRELRAMATYDFRPNDWKDMQVQTMVMMGGESPHFLTDAAKAVRMALPHGTLAVLDHQHHVAMDTAPELFLSTLLDFLGTP